MKEHVHNFNVKASKGGLTASYMSIACQVSLVGVIFAFELQWCKSSSRKWNYSSTGTQKL